MCVSCRDQKQAGIIILPIGLAVLLIESSFCCYCCYKRKTKNRIKSQNQEPKVNLNIVLNATNYHPRMRVGNVFGRVCLSVCVSVCYSFVCTYRPLIRSRSHIKVKVTHQGQGQIKVNIKLRSYLRRDTLTRVVCI